MKSPFQKNLLWLHTWTGLTLGLLIVMLAVTGVGVVLRPMLDTTVNGDLLVVPSCNARMSLDALVANARAAHPNGQVNGIEIPAGATTSTIVRYANSDFVYVDPCSGAVLGEQNRYGGGFGILDWLHRFLFMKNSGQQTAGTITLFFGILLVIGGIVLWWPRTKLEFKSAIKFNPRLPGTARTLSLHKIVGVYTSLIVLELILTAMPISFGTVRDWINKSTGSMPPASLPKSAVHAGVKVLPMETFWEHSKSLVPGQLSAVLRYPSKPTDAVEIQIVEPDAPHKLAKSYLYLDAYTGDVLSFRRYVSDLSIGSKIFTWSQALHTGVVWGLPYQLLLLLATIGIPVQFYSGASPYLRRKLRPSVKTNLALKIVKKTVEATDICTFELADAKGKSLPPFGAGSHVEVKIREGLARQYSLCNDPRETHRYLIGVLRDPKSRGGSQALHDEFNEGDVIQVGIPKNHFPLAHSAKKSLLIAGGIGVTPILCMAERLANIGAEFEMHYFTRSLARTAFVDRIGQSTYASRVSFHFDDGPAEQRGDIPALLAHPDPDTHLYVCGPSGFMDFVLNTATEQGWLDGQVHREYFAGVVHKSDNDVEFDVKIASTGKVYRVAKDKTVVETLAEFGIYIPISCGEGVCSTCLTRVLDGEPDHHDTFLTAAERAKNDQFLPCCSRARSPMLVLDL